LLDPSQINNSDKDKTQNGVADRHLDESRVECNMFQLIKRQRLVAAFAVAAGFLFASQFLCATESRKPNVVLIVTDDHGWGSRGFSPTSMSWR
jgi:hypothetical protein